jgi:predicted GIY-YIG superfamily endonuclease
MNYTVYRIVNDNGHVYYGHTSLTLKRRFNLHKSKTSTSCCKYFNWDKAIIEPMEYVYNATIEQIKHIENEYIDNFECINHNRAIRSKEEKYSYERAWHVANKEYRSEYMKHYNLKRKNQTTGFRLPNLCDL